MPGDKSISHRALILAALAPGRSSVRGLNRGADVRATAEALAQLGVKITGSLDKGQVEIQSSGYDALAEPTDVIDCGNSGTTMRLLAGVAAAVPGLHVLTGDASLRSRPMQRIAEPLREMGASISGRQGGRLPPLVVSGRELSGIGFRSPVASAQVKSAVLLAGLRASGVTSVVEPSPSRDHTERMLEEAGASLSFEGASVAVAGGQTLEARAWDVPGDPSAAMFLIVGAALTPGSDLTLPGLCLSETRIEGLRVLQEMGADVAWEVDGRAAAGPVGTVVARHSELTGVGVEAERIPGLIDEIPILAVAATQADGETTFAGVGELRVKESDRLAALVEMLGSMGSRIEVSGDDLIVSGPSRLKGAEVDSQGDHRMAMAAAIAASIAEGDVRIKGWSSVETSFPEFVETFAAARGVR